MPDMLFQNCAADFIKHSKYVCTHESSKGYGERARDSVNFRKFSPCMARARRVRAGLTALPPMRNFKSLILGKYCTFVCGSLFRVIKLNELYY
jgi:hypothetical protein